jgi:hypothetical protein
MSELPITIGVVAILTDETGQVVASVTDFERQAPGGCSLFEGQKWRAQRMLSFAAIRAFCSPVIVKAMDEFRCDEIVNTLIHKHGFTRTIIPVGHKDVETEVHRARR